MAFARHLFPRSRRPIECRSFRQIQQYRFSSIAPATVSSDNIASRNWPCFPFSVAIAPLIRRSLFQVPLGGVRTYISRKERFKRIDPVVWVEMGQDSDSRPTGPNAGSVKNRKRKKKALQRQAFRKAQSQLRVAQTKAKLAAEKEARKKRWKEGAARARAWAEELQKQEQMKAQG